MLLPDNEQDVMNWPDSDLERIDACPVCGAGERVLEHKNLTDTVFRCAPGSWSLYRCTHCGSAYLDPRPSPQSIGRAYERYYTHTSPTSGRAVSPLRAFYHALCNGYLNRRHGSSLQPSFPLGGMVVQLIPALRARLDARGRHLPPPHRGATLLDVGCGNGHFLLFAGQVGWSAHGVDMDPQAVAQCRTQGLEVSQGGIERYAEQENLFDCITLSHVIEHVHAPLQLLQDCVRLLKPGGILWVETPNIGAQGHQRFGSAWRGLEPPRHLTLFSRRALIGALQRCGLDAVTDAPYQPLCRDLFVKSAALARGSDPYHARVGWCDRLRSIAHERRARRDPDCREFVTLFGRKPS